MAEEENAPITLTIKGQNLGDEQSFRVKKTTPMIKLFASYAGTL
jgi:hypothetical protein